MLPRRSVHGVEPLRRQLDHEARVGKPVVVDRAQQPGHRPALDPGPQGVQPDEAKYGFVQMNGAQVFKFAVGTFPQLIAKTLDKAGLAADQVDLYVCGDPTVVRRLTLPAP